MEELPDEVILKVWSFLPIKELIQCTQLSKRFKAVCSDDSLWQKINLYNKKVPAKFVEFVINKGCKYLNLSHIRMFSNFNDLSEVSKLKYLSLSYRMASDSRWIKIDFGVYTYLNMFIYVYMYKRSIIFIFNLKSGKK